MRSTLLRLLCPWLGFLFGVVAVSTLRSGSQLVFGLVWWGNFLFVFGYFCFSPLVPLGQLVSVVIIFGFLLLVGFFFLFSFWLVGFFVFCFFGFSSFVTPAPRTLCTPTVGPLAIFPGWGLRRGSEE